MVVLIGASGAGKSTFANKHFLPTEVLSSDYCRALVCDDANSQEATGDAFDLLHYMLEKRLHRRRLTVIDATNVQHTGRKSLIDVARRYHCLPVAIVLDVPESVCHARNQQRPDRDFGPHVVRKHRKDLKRSLKHLKREGFRKVIRLKSVEEIEAFAIER
ncbi:MAG: AAA family ATPase, partial [Myxococcota bacterium]|nr:AAA family ATPase [Myxococcota bacterium]